jgi:hypothetical protein
LENEYGLEDDDVGESYCQLTSLDTLHNRVSSRAEVSMVLQQMTVDDIGVEKGLRHLRGVDCLLPPP